MLHETSIQGNTESAAIDATGPRRPLSPRVGKKSSDPVGRHHRPELNSA